MEFKVESDIDFSKFKPFLNAGDDILIGYPEGLPHEGGIQTHELAAILTYGDEDTPARPFLEQGINSQKKDVKAAIEVFYKKKIEGMNYGQALKDIALICVGAVKEFVFGDWFKQNIPNAPSTIRRKSRRQKGKVLASDKPLIDTGAMINSTTFVIKRGDK